MPRGSESPATVVDSPGGIHAVGSDLLGRVLAEDAAGCFRLSVMTNGSARSTRTRVFLARLLAIHSKKATPNTTHRTIGDQSESSEDLLTGADFELSTWDRLAAEGV